MYVSVIAFLFVSASHCELSAGYRSSFRHIDKVYSENIRPSFKISDFSTEVVSATRSMGLPLLKRILLQCDVLLRNDERLIEHEISQSNTTCEECVEFAHLLHELDFDLGKDLVVEVIKKTCIYIKYESQRVCELVVHAFRNQALYLLFKLKPEELCHWLLPATCPKPQGFLPDWNIKLSNLPKPTVTKRKRPVPGSPSSKFLYLTDIHMIIRYTAGSNAECGEPLCCRNNDKPLQNSSQAAGKWGDYRNCDLPVWTVERMMKNLSQYNFDFILFTGDIPAHDVWNQSRSDQIDKNNRFTQLMLKYFPGIPVYVALGNHASSPVNMFPTPQVYGELDGDIRWLYEVIVENWQNWIPEEDMATVGKGAFYTTLIRNGLRLVSLNNNYCTDENWWILVGNNSVDPLGQLQWFAEVMQKAETNREMVMIIAHRPTDGCLEPWRRNYYNIINRFENNIVAQFCGHFHTDELKIFYDDKNTSRVISVGFMGPGYTTYSNLNAGYRIYILDGNYANSTHSIIDADSYYLNITEANISDNPEWRHEYGFLKDYGMESMFPEDFGDLVQRFEKDLDFFQKYYHHLTKDKDMGYCSASCRTDLIKSIKMYKDKA